MRERERERERSVIWPLILKVLMNAEDYGLASYFLTCVDIKGMENDPA